MVDVYEGPALLHVGFPKTGTTALQNDVFSRAERGMGLPAGSFSRARLTEWFITGDGHVYDAAAVAQEMAEHEAPLRTRGLLPVWSDETLVGDPLQQRYDGAWVIDKIAALKRPFKVLITIREQRALVVSLYREFVKAGGVHGLTDFLGTGRETASFTPILRPEYLFYDRAAAACVSRFGAENVLVLPQEMLAASPQAFFSRLGDFLGQTVGPEQGSGPPASHNVGAGAVAMGLRRRFNRLSIRSPLSQRRSIVDRAAYRITSLVDKLCPATINAAAETRLRRGVTERYDGVFSASNRQLEEILGFGLQEYGYQ